MIEESLLKFHNDTVASVEAENRLINHRMQWLIPANALLVAAVGLAGNTQDGFVAKVSFLGILINIIGFCCTCAAVIQICYLRKEWFQKFGKNGDSPFIRPFSGTWNFVFSVLSIGSLPLVFVYFWSTIK